MRSADDLIHRLDANDEIVFVNAAWVEYAERNGAAGLAARVLNTPFWDHVHGAAVRAFSKDLIQSARSQRRAISVPCRCDTPEQRRFLDMVVTPCGADGEVEIRSRLLRTERRLRVPTPSEGKNEIVVVCAWCKRYQVQHDWHEIEEAASALGIFMEAKEIKVSHGICEDCLARQFEAMGSPRV